MDTIMSSSLVFQTMLFLVCLALCALFSFIETSITGLRLYKLKEIAQKSAGRYKLFFNALENSPQRVLGSILIANSLAVTSASALITNVMEHVFARLNWSSGLGFSIGIGIATTAILIVGEILPKNIAKTHSSEKYFKSTLWISNAVFRFFEPVAAFLTRFSDYFLATICNPEEGECGDLTSEKEIQFLIDHVGQRGLMETEKTEMLRNIFELGITPIKEIMVPATDIISVETSMPIEQTLEIFTKHHFTRLPVYKDSPDNIIGIVHLKDIFFFMSEHQKKSSKIFYAPYYLCLKV